MNTTSINALSCIIGLNFKQQKIKLNQYYNANLNLYQINDFANQQYTNEGILVTGLSCVNLSLSIHNIIYKMINTINSHFYIGKHTTNNIFDSYYGSGTALKAAYIKYGLYVFQKEILFDFENVSDCYDKERELMPELSCRQFNINCYNLKPGGYGGATSEAAQKGALTRQLHGYKCSEETKYKISQANKGKHRTLQQRIYMSKIKKQKALKGKDHPMYGKRGKNSPNYKRKHTVEECKRISKNRQYKYGKENHCYGRKKMILPNSTTGILVKPEDIQKYLDLGYTFSAYSSYKNS